MEKFRFNNLDALSDLYTVRTKTGTKNDYFTDLTAATDFAAASSKSRHTTYIVWHSGKAITAYCEGKKLKNYERVYYKYDPFNWDKQTMVKGQPVAWAIARAEDAVKVTKTYFETFQMKNGKLGCHFVNKSISFHKDGRVYIYFRGVVRNCPEEIKYDLIFLPEDGAKILVEELRKLRPELAHIITELMIKHLPMVFAYPNYYLKTDLYTGFVSLKNTANKIKHYYPRTLMNEDKLVEYVAKRLNIPCTKVLKKYYMQNNRNMVFVVEAMNAGITKIDNIIKCAMRFSDIVEQNPCGFSKWEMLQNKLLRKLVAVKGENRVTKMICEEDPTILRDSLNMILTDDVEDDIVDFIFMNASNFQEIHDTVTRYVNRSHRQLTNREICYTENELKLNGTFDGVTFSLAKDSKELAIIGAAMGICVGGYARAAVNKNTTIVKAMRGTEYVACIELNDKRLVQLKAKFNNPVKQEYKRAIDLWLAHNGINAEHCHDYKNIGEPWTSSYRYNRIDPAEYEEHDDSVLRIVKSEKSRPIFDYDWMPNQSYSMYDWEVSIENYGWDNDITPEHTMVECEDDELPF